MDLKACFVKENEILINLHYSAFRNVEELIKNLKNFILENECKKLTLNLKGTNLIYASQVGIMSATHHFMKYLDGTITLIVDSQNVKESIDLLSLGNTTVVVDKTSKSRLIA